jgi:hypothetical protein
MRDLLGIGLIVFSAGLLVSGVMKRRSRSRTVHAAGAIRPEFAAMGEIVRPLILFAVGFVALKMSAFYFLLGGDQFLSPLDFAGLLCMLGAYSAWLILVTKRPEVAASPAPEPMDGAAHPVPAAGE